MKNLIVCCDGTWNSPDDKDEGIPCPTNVVKFYRALASETAAGVVQLKYYHPGVGTGDSLVDRFAGGALGVGLSRNIKSAYNWLGIQYRSGDQIVLIGFSRGAYTVRSLAGMIDSCGLLDLSDPDESEKVLWDRIDRVFDNYRRKKKDRLPLNDLRFHDTQAGHAGAGNTAIHFLGVWDTVGSLGIPDQLGLLNIFDSPQTHSFHDTKLSPMVRHGRHALAIDERRESFTPTLWTDYSPQRDVTQIWFPGVHSDVGGGYAAKGLSDNSLRWMIEEAGLLGVGFRDNAVEQIPGNSFDQLHDSLTGFFGRLNSRPRTVPFLTRDADENDFHLSARDRCKNPPLSQEEYWPSMHLEVGQEQSLDVFARKKWNDTGLYFLAGEQYEFSARGEWMDSSIKSPPGGTNDGKFQIGKIGHIAASALGVGERWFQRLSGNKDANFLFTRREGNMPWFALVGVVANGSGEGKGDDASRHESFCIGDSTSHTPAREGYLYCFANNSWETYFNNRGSVRLTVRRVR